MKEGAVPNGSASVPGPVRSLHWRTGQRGRESRATSRLTAMIVFENAANTTSPALNRQRGKSDMSNGADLQAIDQRGHWSTDLLADTDGGNEEATLTVFADLTLRTQEMRRT